MASTSSHNWATRGPKSSEYGWDWQKKRKAWAARHQPWHLCTRCEQPLGPMGPHLHLDHDDDDRTIIRGFAHAACNLRAGAKKARALQLARPRYADDCCAWCGTDVAPGRKYCSRRCGFLGSREGRHKKPCAECGQLIARNGNKYCTGLCLWKAHDRSVRDRRSRLRW